MTTLYLANEKGLGVLKHLLDEGFDAKEFEVVCARDSGVAQDYYDEIRDLCTANGIKHTSRKHHNGHDGYAIAVGWRFLLPSDGLIVLHDSPLPRYRGFCPLVSMLINGETQLGVTALWAADDYDVGDIIFQSHTSITYPITIAKAIKEIQPLYNELVSRVLSHIIYKHPLPRRPQVAQASYSLWRDEEDYRIDWNWDAERIKRFVDAVGKPFRGASARIGDDLVRIWRCKVYDSQIIESERSQGKIIFMNGTNPVVVCGNGLIEIINMSKKITNFRVRFK